MALIFAPVYSPLISTLLAHIGHKPPSLPPLQLPPVQPPSPPTEGLADVLMPAFNNQTALPIRIKILVEGLLDQRLNNSAAERAAVCSVLHVSKWSEADLRRGFVHVDPLTGRAPTSIRMIGVTVELTILRSIGMMLPALHFFVGSLWYSLISTVRGAESSFFTRTAAHSLMFPHNQQPNGAMNHGYSTTSALNPPANNTPVSTPPSGRSFSGPLISTAAAQEKPVVVKAKTDPAKATKRVMCPICERSFCDKSGLKIWTRIHHSAVHAKDQHTCIVPGCSRTFSSRRSRNRHSSNANLHHRNGLQTVGQVLAELVPRCRERISGGRKYLLPTVTATSSAASFQSSDVSSSSALCSSKTNIQRTSETDEGSTSVSSQKQT
ncbi:hypothetical protein M3Y99_01827800 [Aphelenchoides fujianensis]|nr:hypothetical protein M3Y99_01827800 [Aphelenchoides fujianensis]